MYLATKIGYQIETGPVHWTRETTTTATTTEAGKFVKTLVKLIWGFITLFIESLVIKTFKDG